ncbi:Putative acetyltransferase [Streptococcus constellatus]|uniref:Acetyltransferase n=1 Tax=Streptococcus constellatus TaxID=76860 RepID=A0A564TYI6_STRCV|nr:sugar O-acetyltransferase [Streptococcus constellatus]VUX02850.1 Putative acetyltransferase [Streptococcus gordonii]VUX12289.1 Putative acetyltransferase [Streptococcus constellatus]
MASELEKMKRGDWYDANFDQELVQKRMEAQDLCFELNQLKPSREEERAALLKKLMGQDFEGLVLLSPFTCDYGENITFGKNCFVNINCYFMDGAKISLGDNVFVGPSTGFYTANHPLDYKRRNAGLEKALPITVGNNVWFGANVNVMPGVSIGDGCVIASGSVVTQDIPANSLAAGVPCKVLKKIEQD